MALCTSMQTDADEVRGDSFDRGPANHGDKAIGGAAGSSMANQQNGPTARKEKPPSSESARNGCAEVAMTNVVDAAAAADVPGAAPTQHSDLAAAVVKEGCIGHSLAPMEQLPAIDSLLAPKMCADRLIRIIGLLESEETVTKDELIRNLQYTASLLNMLYVEESRPKGLHERKRRLLDEDDSLTEVQPDAVPTEVREWLAETFTRAQSSSSNTRAKGERPKFKSVANAVRAGLMVERIYRSVTNSSKVVHVPPDVAKVLKELNSWSFNIFELNDKSGNCSLRYMTYEVLHRQNLISKFKIDDRKLMNFLAAAEQGYSRHGNPYHNLVHGADVTHTTYYILRSSGLMKWLTDVESFATIIAAATHDYEHTGTTNNFHIMTRSPLAMLYNDRSVLENFHVSSVFQLMDREDMNIVTGLKKEEYREFRTLVIELVLGTDMSAHFQQLKSMKSLLQCPESIEKAKALSIVVHCADISHPTKEWCIHKRWTDLLLQEFFKQGDREKELGLPCSPLCDRASTLIEKSQIGFIDFIVNPSFQLMGSMLEKVVRSSQSAKYSVENEGNMSAAVRRTQTTLPETKYELDRQWTLNLRQNRNRWTELAEAAADSNDVVNASSDTISDKSSTSSSNEVIQPPTVQGVEQSEVQDMKE